MELIIESKIGKIASAQQQVYNFLSNFKNFAQLIPKDKIKNIQVSEDECTFEVDMIGKCGLKYIHREPFNILKLGGLNNNQDFFLWIQLKEATLNVTHIKLTLKAEMNAMMKLMAEKPLKNFLDVLVDKLSGMQF